MSQRSDDAVNRLELALCIDELLQTPNGMALTGEMVFRYLDLPEWQPHEIVANRIPEDPSNPSDFSDELHADYPPLTIQQIAAIMAALRDALIPGIEPVVPSAWTAEGLRDDVGPVDVRRSFGWFTVMDRVGAVGDYALPWLKALFRRFERFLGCPPAQPDQENLRPERTEQEAPEPGGAAEEASSPPSLRSIRRRGANWEVRFEDEEGSFPVKDYSAIQTVSQIVAQPNRPFELKELVDEETRRLLEDPESCDPTHDNVAMRDLRRRRDELMEMRDDPDPLVQQEYQSELVLIAEEIKKQSRPGGGSRKLGKTLIDRSWDALCKSLTRLWPRLRKDMPKLADHLQKAFKIDRPTITYHLADSNQPWDTAI